MRYETAYSVELVSRKRYLSANSLRDTYAGTLRRSVPPIPVKARECPQEVPPAGTLFDRKVVSISFRGPSRQGVSNLGARTLTVDGLPWCR